MSNETIYIVDGSAYIFRAFYAMPVMRNKDRMPINALHGFTSMLRKLLEDENPDYVAVTFDPYDEPEPGFRSKIYPEYKTNRPPTPPDLKPQLPYFERIVQALSIPRLSQPGMEADDLIASLTRKARERGLDVCIVSADKDLLQLVGDGVRMIDTMRGKTFTAQDAEKRFGVPPEKIKFVMALSGDSSDNIPGVPGIGEKIGGQLIAEFGDLETLLANIDRVNGPKRRERLAEFADQARMSLELVTLRDDCPVECDLDALRLTPPDQEQLEALFAELSLVRPLSEIRGWMRRRGWIEGAKASNKPRVEKIQPRRAEDWAKRPKQYRQILTIEALDAFLAECKAAPRVAFDLETTSRNPLDAVIVGFAMSCKPTQAVYIPTEHRYIGAPRQLATEQVLQWLRPLLEGDERKIVCQNVKYETLVLARNGVTLRAVEYDTMLMSYLLDPGRISQGLDALAKDYLQHEMVRYKNVAGSSGHAVDFDLVDLETATGYAAEDADATLALCDVLEPALRRAELRKIHDEIELPLVGVLARMEETGVCINTDILRELSREFERELTALQRQIDESAGQRLNPNSPQQLREVLFERLGLPVKKQTKSGASTDQSVLEELAELHELPDLILQFRSFSKLKGTYVDALPSLRHPKTGRIHTDFNQAVTATGRLSSSNPNLQNIPVRSARGREIRRAFVPQNGWKLIVADYSQIELRLMAHLSGDPKLVNAYRNGDDIHRLTASEVFDLPLEEVTDDRRAAAKTINFGVMYGMGAARLARSLKIRQPQAREYIANYFQRYEGVADYFHRLRTDARTTGYSETMFGRRRLMEELFTGSRAQKAFAERVAVNMPIQGSSADIIKLAMIALDAEIRRRELPVHLLLQVHDELVLECHPEVVEDASALVRETMEGVVELQIPLEVDLGVGENWYEAK